MSPIQRLISIMAKLRDPQNGCPWDKEQNFESIAPYTIEEAYEVVDAIDRKNWGDLKEELGDLLLQVVYHAQMANEKKLFDFNDVAADIATKMISRHPHVFGSESAKTASDVNVLWEQKKDEEKKRQEAGSILDDVPRNLPALLRAQKLQKRAASTGFEWNKAADVLDKLEEEVAEMREAIAGGKQEEVMDELGDLFFVLVNFGRMLGVNCEETLRHANNKFERRFKGMELESKEKEMDFQTLSLQEKEELWQSQKRKERLKG